MLRNARAQLNDVVQVADHGGHHAGLIGHVVEVHTDDPTLVRLHFTSNDTRHWYSTRQLTVMYRPGLVA